MIKSTILSVANAFFVGVGLHLFPGFSSDKWEENLWEENLVHVV